MKRSRVGVLLLAAACAREAAVPPAATDPAPAGMLVAVRDTTWPSYLEASGLAEPLERAVLSSRLMATVEDVLVQEGAAVRRGQVLVRLDPRDVRAGSGQAEAQLAAARAARDDAERTAIRLRNLYTDSAAPRAQMDQAEAMLARADAGLRAAEAGVASASAMASHAVVRAPFDGVVTLRYVDPGAFAAPGAPLVTVESTKQLRVRATIPAGAVGMVRRGQVLPGRLEGQEVSATVEGLGRVGGSVQVLNALVGNPAGRFVSGSAATVLIPGEPRRAVVAPAAALVRQGDLTAAWRISGNRRALTWVRAGDVRDGVVEILSGLVPGDTVLVSQAEAAR